MKCKRSSDGRSVDLAARTARRTQAVKAVREGQPVTEVARAYGVAVRTVYRWLSNFANEGQTGLTAKPKSGRPPKVTPEEMAWIARTVREETPQQMRFPYALWTLSLIRELIRRHLGKSLTPASVSRIMKLLGFTPQKPLYRAWQQDAELVRRWEAETYPEIRRRAQERGATIYFADESGIRSDHHAGRTWAPEAETPVIEKTGRRFGLNLISAVGPRGEFRFMVHQGTVNAVVFRRFLQRLMVGATGPVFVIVDGHPAHKAKLVREYVASTNGQLELHFLPPYAPQLNPDELVWAHVKRDIGRRGVENLEEMKRLALGALRRIQKLPQLVRSFFHHPTCRYTIATDITF